MARVGNYFNVYSKYDWVQTIGGPWWCVFCSRRTDPCAVNIGIDSVPGIGNVGHTDFHTPEVWNAMESWLVRAGYGLNPTDVNGHCGIGPIDPSFAWEHPQNPEVQQGVN